MALLRQSMPGVSIRGHHSIDTLSFFFLLTMPSTLFHEREE